jgi:hypothetical protein
VKSKNMLSYFRAGSYSSRRSISSVTEILLQKIMRDDHLFYSFSEAVYYGLGNNFLFGVGT